MNAEPRNLSPHVHHARRPRTVAQDIVEIDGILERIAKRYPLAFDLAFTAGGGGGIGGRAQLQYVDPTQDIAISVAKDIQRARVAREGQKIQKVLKLLREIDAGLAPSRWQREEYDPAWQPAPDQGFASDEELGEQLRKQRERARRGEL